MIEAALQGGFEDLFVDLFIRLNFMNYLSSAWEQCINREGGPRTRYEDRLVYIKQIISSLIQHQTDKPLASFYNILRRMSTWKNIER